MIVAPYKRTPSPPTVAVLTADGVIVDEGGDTWQPGEQPAHVRAWVDYDTVRLLLAAGHGEALCWNGEEIRWRHHRQDEIGWTNRRTDVAVLKVPFPQETRQALQGLARWRNWLESYGASPTGTAGGAAWSLLRATLPRVLFTGEGDPPPLIQTMGGRMLIGARGQGTYRGDLRHVDLSAAYASTLAGLSYGGRWHRASDLPVVRPPEWWALGGRPVFARARVRVPPDLRPAPLIRRPRARMSQLQLYVDQLMNDRYPAGVTMRGLWTWQELEAAEEAGAKIMEVADLYVHVGGWPCFDAWWKAIVRGRERGGFAGVLAKITGNALWGRFCMIPAGGQKTIRSVTGQRVRSRPVRSFGGIPPAHDLAESVSGQVRARLYDAVRVAGPRLVSAHTDGLWAEGLDVGELPAGWRQKGAARRLDLIDPQTIRYWPRPADDREPFHVMAGRPPLEQPQAFQEAWDDLGLESA